MLAGRTGAFGQLNHARNLLAHAERLINDRVHNRLIPAEREEFFEQLARLRLTLADADAEAEVQAAEEQVVSGSLRLLRWRRSGSRRWRSPCPDPSGTDRDSRDRPTSQTSARRRVRGRADPP